jgi:hypothetical protein
MAMVGMLSLELGVDIDFGYDRLFLSLNVSFFLLN